MEERIQDGVPSLEAGAPEKGFRIMIAPVAQERRFPFGRPVLARGPAAAEKRKIFILGAYPGALHAAWSPPTPFKKIKALPVDNEPEAFWDGQNEDELFEAWKQAVAYDEERWGSVAPAKAYNGAAGKKLGELVLEPLSLKRGEAWITNCLDSYRSAADAAVRVAKAFEPFAEVHGLKPSSILAHPSENSLVEETLAFQKDRILEELAAASPELIITLGNAALRVMRLLVQTRASALPEKLSARVSAYGQRLPVTLNGRPAELLPLAHPALPAAYRTVHEEWLAGLPAPRK